MKDSLFTIVVKRLPTPTDKHYLHTVLYTDGKGYLYDMRPNKLGKPAPLFNIGDVLEIDGSSQTIQQIEPIPPMADKVIESLWEGRLAYSSNGFFGFRYFIGVQIYE